MRRTLPALLPVILLLALPLAFYYSKGCRTQQTADEYDVLTVITPHAESIKHEMQQGFDRYYLKNYGRHVKIEFLSPGGTSDIVRYLNDRFAGEVKYRILSGKAGENTVWDDTAARAWSGHAGADHAVRRFFLDSDIGIGIDIFAGGGVFEHADLARRGIGVDGGVQKRHPEYFANDNIPASFGGEDIYDREHGRFYSICLSSFGIVCNIGRILETGEKKLPEKWEDLTDKRFFNSIVVADPTKSGSVNKCFEAIVQQQMAQAAAEYGEEKGPSIGWANGLNLIKGIIGNARTVTDSAGKAVRDVAAGEAAAGMAIDFYALSEAEWAEFRCGRNRGQSQIHYIPPRAGAGVSGDPVMLLRGAPHRKTAEAFLDYLLSAEGQKIFSFRPGMPDGPEKYALRRSPVRRDVYADKFKPFRSDPDYNPYEAGSDFIYRSEWTGRYFNLLRQTIKLVMLEARPELAAAQKAIADAGGADKVPQAYAEFCRLPYTYAEAEEISRALRHTSPEQALAASRLGRCWTDEARKQYRKAEELAKAGK